MWSSGGLLISLTTAHLSSVDNKYKNFYTVVSRDRFMCSCNIEYATNPRNTPTTGWQLTAPYHKYYIIGTLFTPYRQIVTALCMIRHLRSLIYYFMPCFDSSYLSCDFPPACSVFSLLLTSVTLIRRAFQIHIPLLREYCLATKIDLYPRPRPTCYLS